MNINELMPNIDTRSFITDYCEAHDIIDVQSFLTPTRGCIEPIEHYDNMQSGYELLKDKIGGKVCILVDPDP